MPNGPNTARQSALRGAIAHPRARGATGILVACAALLAVPASAAALASPAPVSPPIQTNGVVEAIVQAGGETYIGGNFTQVTVAGVTATRDRIAAIRADGSLDTTFSPAIDQGQVEALAVSTGGVVYAGGDFTSAGGTARTQLAAFDATGALEAAFKPNLKPFTNGAVVVDALATSGTTLYVGGTFQQASNQSFAGLAPLSTTTGAVVPGFAAPGSETEANVEALALGNGELYVGGGQLPRPDPSEGDDGGLRTSPNTVIAVDPASFTPDPTFNPHVGTSDALDALDHVDALAYSGSRLYVGGGFSTVNDTVKRDDLAALDATTGIADPNFDPNIGPGPYNNSNGPFDRVDALAISGNVLYAGGDFATVNNGAVTRTGLADVDLVKGTVGAFAPQIAQTGNEFAPAVLALADSGSQLLVGGQFDTVGNITQSDFAQFPDTPTSPIAVTGTASGQTKSGATVSGTVNPDALTTAYTFEYGTSTQFGSITPVVELDDAITPEPLSQTLTGLAPNTLYLYRIVATNSAGTSFGPVTSFTTTGTPEAPTVATGAASGITSTAATLAGTVDPNAEQTTFTFEYGPNNNFGSISTVVALDNAGQVEPVSAALSGLSPGTNYRYRVVATNATGTTAGAVGTFTTNP
ncbi:MAG TPA: fibronectin type III domain-containing protein [Solirubrobacteraceae bacterium]